MVSQQYLSLSRVLIFLQLLLLFGHHNASMSSDEVKKLYIVYMGERWHNDPIHVTNGHHETLASILGSKEEALASIVHSYKHGFSGLPGVIQVMLSRTFEVQTTRSWDFLGLNFKNPSELIEKSNFGDGVIVGVLDTGIWPESNSFNDEGYGPIPSRWKGKCETGQSFNASHCNRKIIGARYYTGGVDAKVLKGEYKSPRDFNGHGTHTASTIAGSLVKNVSFHGLASGVVKGGAPRARLAIYKGQGLVYHQEDGFKGLSFSLSCQEGDLNTTEIKGTIVLCSSLNKPLQISFINALTNVLKAGGDGIIYTQSVDNLFDQVASCEGLPCVLVDTEIAKQILDYDQIESDSPSIVKVSPTHSATGEKVWAPRVAAFSSRGPSTLFPGVLKPDIGAPGVNILAAKKDGYVFMSGTSMACPHISGVVALLKSVHPRWSSAAIKSAIMTTASVYDKYGVPIAAEGKPRKMADPFDFGSGHVDPNRAMDPGLVYDIKMADYVKIFNCTLNLIPDCATLPLPAYDLNLPSISVPDLKMSVTVWRTVTNVGPENSIYKAIVEPPPGIKMEVKPSVLTFDAKTKTRGFQVTFTSLRRVQGGYTFGSLTWSDGLHKVRSPIAVRTVIEDFYADAS
ncbi:Subtilisin-like protease [Acorus calamus]|uniref:Subtilisin-like protease n=1 Tax=Acorus calamus TaxID=4465 RepID=A0AAV9FAY9_ACOCL|nr:Subtilisin-like protease [Acorus calamus]